jgi:outer membrane protein
MRSIYWLMSGVAALAVAGQPASAETLKEALAAAYTGNPELAAQRAAQRAQDEDVSSALAGYRPTVAGSADLTYSDINNKSPGQDYGSFSRQFGAQVTQPLFRGFRTQNQVKAAEASVRAGRENLRSVEIGVMLDTVSAYMNVVRDQAVLGLQQNQVQVLDRQLKATQDRFKVGELTRTDTAQSQARLSAARTQVIGAQGTLTASREAYRRVVGRAPEMLDQPPALAALPASVDEAIEIALKESPVSQSARAIEEAAKYSIDIAKGALWPTLNADAGLTRSDQDVPIGGGRTADDGRTIASIGTRLTIPLFQSGAEYSAIRRAQQQRSQRMLQIAAAERQVTESVRNAWEQVQTARSSIASTQDAVKANEIALEGVKQEQQVGSRTILDVLDAEQELLNTRVSLVQAQRNEYVASFALLAAMGRATAENLQLGVDLYNPDTNYQAVRNRMFGFSDDK